MKKKLVEVIFVATFVVFLALFCTWLRHVYCEYGPGRQIEGYWVENAVKLANENPEANEAFQRLTSDGVMTWSDYKLIQSAHGKGVMNSVRKYR